MDQRRNGSLPRGGDGMSVNSVLASIIRRRRFGWIGEVPNRLLCTKIRREKTTDVVLIRYREENGKEIFSTSAELR
jgi:hypothetical protein